MSSSIGKTYEWKRQYRRLLEIFDEEKKKDWTKHLSQLKKRHREEIKNEK